MIGNQEVVALDIDDVLRPSTFQLSNAYAEQHGLTFEHPAILLPDGTLRGMLQVFKEGTPHYEEDEIIDIVEGILGQDEFVNPTPVPGSVEGVAHLAEKRRLIAVSSCPEITRMDTETWVEGHYTGMIEEVHVIGGRWGRGSTVDKWQTLKAIGADYLVDDLVRNATKARLVGAKAILFGEYPWNRTDELPDHVTRCKDWPEVKEYFDERG
jgi:hypothetical protein